MVLNLIGGLTAITIAFLLSHTWLSVRAHGTDTPPPVDPLYQAWLVAVMVMTVATFTSGIVYWLTSAWNLLL